jgi:hypothetical protein
MYKPGQFKNSAEEREAMLQRAVASQIPMHTTRASYNAMLAHCVTESTKTLPVWACAKNGARIYAKCVKMTIWDRDTTTIVDYAPVLHLYCSGCDAAPNVHGGDSIFADELRTLAV